MASGYYRKVKARNLRRGMKIFTGLRLETVTKVKKGKPAGWIEVHTDSGGPVEYEADSQIDVMRKTSLARIQSPRSNPAGKSVRLRNFSGTITRNANGTVSVKGRKK